MEAAIETTKEQQIPDIQISRHVELPVAGYDPSNYRIQLQVKDLSYLDNAVKLLLGQQPNQAESNIQLISQPQNLQDHQTPAFAIANIQNDPAQSLAQSELECVGTELKSSDFGIFLPQEKKDCVNNANDDAKLISDETQRSKLFTRKVKNIKANMHLEKKCKAMLSISESEGDPSNKKICLEEEGQAGAINFEDSDQSETASESNDSDIDIIDELQKKAGITAVTLFHHNGAVQFAGPENMASLAENRAFKNIFINAVTKNDSVVAKGTSTHSKRSSRKEKAPALPWSCEECESSFTTQHNLINHKLLSHSGLTVHRCEMCNKEFVDITVFQKHLTTHAEDNLFQCKICGNAFTAKNLLNTHMKVHNEEKPYSCKVCMKSFHSTSSLQYHMNKHGPEKKCVCQHCKKEFTKMSSLKVHMRIHTGEQPYRCQECGKGFIVSTHLTRHLRVHSGEKPYLCEVCGKRFNRSSHLRIHFRIHSGEKPYECEICGKKFNQTVSRKKHLKTHMK